MAQRSQHPLPQATLLVLVLASGVGALFLPADSIGPAGAPQPSASSSQLPGRCLDNQGTSTPPPPTTSLPPTASPLQTTLLLQTTYPYLTTPSYPTTPPPSATAPPLEPMEGTTTELVVEDTTSSTAAPATSESPQPAQFETETEASRSLRDALPEFFQLASSRLGGFADKFPFPLARSMFRERPSSPPLPSPSSPPFPSFPSSPSYPSSSPFPSFPSFPSSPSSPPSPPSSSSPPSPPSPSTPWYEPPSVKQGATEEDEISKDVYIHLAADEPVTTTPLPPLPLPPRKHYKIIVIKPPTAPPPVIATTRATNVETLIYVLVPKGGVPTPPPTTPRPPSKHEVFFIRYKTADQSISFKTNSNASTTSTPETGTSLRTLLALDEDRLTGDADTHDFGIMPRSPPAEPRSDEDENEVDTKIVEDSVNDLSNVSTNDILQSWRQADGDLHFEENLMKRVARSHVPPQTANATRDAGSAAETKDDRRSPTKPDESDHLGKASKAREGCKLALEARDLNNALDSRATEEGRQITGGPDFKAVLQRRAHLGRGLLDCAEEDSKPFAASDTIKQDDSDFDPDLLDASDLDISNLQGDDLKPMDSDSGWVIPSLRALLKQRSPTSAKFSARFSS